MEGKNILIFQKRIGKICCRPGYEEEDKLAIINIDSKVESRGGLRIPLRGTDKMEKGLMKRIIPSTFNISNLKYLQDI